MQHLPHRSSGPPAPILTAQKVFAWNFDFEFLMNKADHELNLSLTDGTNSFFPHAMNFAVTIHAIADHLWHIKEIHHSQWVGCQSNFVNWVKTQNDCMLSSLISQIPINIPIDACKMTSRLASHFTLNRRCSTRICLKS
jgi:hypothetical protein